MRSETVIACDFRRGLILIGGTSYAGEIKKAAFTYLNFRLPAEGVMPMHCSANVGPAGDVAIFFGLSGTGKTTLSADPSRTLIGDDEHGWSEEGVFNFEGRLLRQDDSPVAGSRAADPRGDAAIRHGAGKRRGQRAVVSARLRRCLAHRKRPRRLSARRDRQRQYHRPRRASEERRAADVRCVWRDAADRAAIASRGDLSLPLRYTAKVAGTERGVVEPSATFSTCFGAPFMPRHPAEYGRLLESLIERHGASCWLVNTGWTGGPYGTGKRMPIAATRALLSAALDGSLATARFRREPALGFSIPEAVPGIDTRLLTPRETWVDKDAYDKQAAKLAKMFAENFRRFEKDVGADVLAAGPHAG